MARATFVIVASLLVATASHGQQPAQGRTVIESLHDPAMRPLDLSQVLPDDVLRVCVDDNQRLAKPGERWSPTDAMQLGDQLPRRRLIWAEQGGAFVVVHFEQGGIAHTYHVVVLRTLFNGGLRQAPSGYTVVTRIGSRRLRDYADFLSGIDSGEVVLPLGTTISDSGVQIFATSLSARRGEEDSRRLQNRVNGICRGAPIDTR